MTCVFVDEMGQLYSETIGSLRDPARDLQKFTSWGRRGDESVAAPQENGRSFTHS